MVVEVSELMAAKDGLAVERTVLAVTINDALAKCGLWPVN